MTREQGLAMIKILFVKNGYWKLLSLIIAVLIHFSIRSEISHLRVVTIPVEADFDSASMGAAIESVEPRAVQITLRGSYSEVNKLDSAQMSCVVKPKQKTSSLLDTVAVKIRSSNLRGVRGVRVVAIDPNVAVVKFDVPMSLKVAVAPPVIQGKARGRVQLVYDQTNAVVKGSRRVLSPLDVETVRVQTDAIDVEGRSQSFATRVRLYPPGEAVNAVVEPSDMVVNVLIISEKATARLERVPVVVVQPPGDANRWLAEPAWIDVEVTGRSEVIKAITFGQILASVNGAIPVSTLSVTNDVPVTIHVQQGLAVDEVKAVPSTVRLIPAPAGPALPPTGER
ncbi:MAG TPA: hypothetical protein P5026_10140 [Kiritimatiellia bacterium]|nr:hypothetical protein [Kiritimatiellia bacterium]HRU69693.1 hypothetical protein [Kiritimatiellia bacterium]